MPILRMQIKERSGRKDGLKNDEGLGYLQLWLIINLVISSMKEEN